jgi:hypothetical protein
MNDLLTIEMLGRPISSYAMVAGILVFVLAARIVALRALRKRPRGSAGVDSRRRASLELVVRRFVIPSLYVGAAAASASILNLADSARVVAEKAIIGLSLFFGARLIVSLLGRRFEKRTLGDEDKAITERVRPLFGLIKALIWLAAQSILGDLFSYFIIFFDKPFVEGDFIVLDDISGNIEHIGMKTTKIRALGGEQVVVANSMLTGSKVRNFKRMERRRIAFSVNVVLETEQGLAESIPLILRGAMESRPSAVFDRAHLKGIGSSSLEFEGVYYMESPDYVEYMDTHQAVLFAVMEGFASKGIRLAYPTTTVYCATAPAASRAGGRSAP